MDSVRDDLGTEPFVHERLAQNAGIAVSQRTHGIEHVGGVAHARGHTRLRSGQIRIRMPHAHANPAPGRFLDNPSGTL